jgi:hypothetical protein
MEALPCCCVLRILQHTRAHLAMAAQAQRRLSEHAASILREDTLAKAYGAFSWPRAFWTLNRELWVDGMPCQTRVTPAAVMRRLLSYELCVLWHSKHLPTLDDYRDLWQAERAWVARREAAIVQ